MHFWGIVSCVWALCVAFLLLLVSPTAIVITHWVWAYLSVEFCYFVSSDLWQWGEDVYQFGTTRYSDSVNMKIIKCVQSNVMVFPSSPALPCSTVRNWLCRPMRKLIYWHLVRLSCETSHPWAKCYTNWDLNAIVKPVLQYASSHCGYKSKLGLQFHR